METQYVILGALVIVALVAGYGLARLLDRLRLITAQTKGAEILTQAQREAEGIRKDVELKTKDELFRKREESNREMEQVRAEHREQERRLEKREDVVDQKHQLQLKKERTLEHVQRKLSERKELLEKRSRELEGLIQRQTEKLQEITNLSRPDAEKLLFERLEEELSQARRGAHSRSARRSFV